MTEPSQPNQSHPSEIVRAGAPLDQAHGAIVAVHGRNATAKSILELVAAIDTARFAWIAPQAAGNTWYPNRFIAPIESNEPGISLGMAAIDASIALAADAGIARDRIVLLGFSQGACLTLEYTARQAVRYGGVLGLSGGLIGPDGTPRDYAGSLAGTPVLLGCSDIDPHIPIERVHETAEVLTRIGGEVDLRIYPGLGHTVNPDEIKASREILSAVHENGNR